MRPLAERYESACKRLAPLPQELGQLNRLAREAYGIIGNVFRRYDVLLVVYALCIAAIVLTNDRNAPRSLYFFAVLPAAFFVGLWFARRAVTASVVFWSVAVYLLAVGFASLGRADIPRHDLSQHFRLIPLILSYLLVVGLLASDARSLNRLLTWSALILSISALFNLSVFLLHSGAKCPVFLSAERLCSVIGMPDYLNSTNLSAPYALYAVAAIAVLQQGHLARLQQIVLAFSAAVLLAALMLTGSRSGFVAAALGCTVLAMLGHRWCRLAVVAAAVVAAVAIVAYPHLREVLMARGASYRPEIWSSYFSFALDRPWGRGVLANIDMRMRDGYVVDQPHNMVLSAFVRGGVIGALALATAIAAGIYQAARYWAGTRNAIPLALIVTMLGYGMLDYQVLATYPTWPWITFWFPLGICVGVETVLRGVSPSGAVAAELEQPPA